MGTELQLSVLLMLQLTGSPIFAKFEIAPGSWMPRVAASYKAIALKDKSHSG
jgi:hypothetical protein